MIMGCLFEVIFEIFGEILFEFVVYSYIKIMTLIVPERKVTEETKEKIRNAAIIVSVILAFVLVLGLIFMASGVRTLVAAGKYMTYIPLGIILLQIISGIVLRIIDRHRGN